MFHLIIFSVECAEFTASVKCLNPRKHTKPQTRGLRCYYCNRMHKSVTRLWLVNFSPKEHAKTVFTVHFSVITADQLIYVFRGKTIRKIVVFKINVHWPILNRLRTRGQKASSSRLLASYRSSCRWKLPHTNYCFGWRANEIFFNFMYLLDIIYVGLLIYKVTI